MRRLSLELVSYAESIYTHDLHDGMPLSVSTSWPSSVPCIDGSVRLNYHILSSPTLTLQLDHRGERRPASSREAR